MVTVGSLVRGRQRRAEQSVEQLPRRPASSSWRSRPSSRLGGRSSAPVAHSHSMVPGGFEVMSRVTRLISRTSLVIRVEIRSRTS
jgi:hypothetical protein